MGWMQKLYETYEHCESLVGVQEDPNKQPLMPIYHSTQQAQVEVMIDMNGSWRHGRARVLLDKNERTTLIPVTEKSSARTSGPVPHPLFDGLKYIAGDYSEYRDPKDSHYDEYMKQLSDWCLSPFAHPKVCAVEKYLKRATLMTDLIEDGILYRKEDGTLPEKWDGKKEETPNIFKVCTGDPADAFVRFRVIPADGSESDESDLWKDSTVWKSFIDYQNSLPAERDYCYVRGEKVPVSSISPKYIRRPGDGAKLVSSNDSSGFTYRGRFESAAQALCIGRETTEKAHNALKWLIAKQGYFNEDQVILAWSTNGEKIIDPCQNSMNALLGLEENPEPIHTGKEFAARFRKALAGYAGKLEHWQDACVIGLDSATPGRLSVFYYRELNPQDFIRRLNRWHTTCTWHLLGFAPALQEPGEKLRPIPFDGAPSPAAIVRAAYGERADGKLKKSTVERLLPCIVDGACLPYDIVQCAARRATNSVVMEREEAQRTLGVACALIRKYHNDKANRPLAVGENDKEVWKMILDENDPNQKNRNFLFGRALAYLQKIETYALSVADEVRMTNAERRKVEFVRHPAKTLVQLDGAIIPYLQKLDGKGKNYYSAFLRVISSLKDSGEFSNVPLSEIYLLGYACQMQQFEEEKQINIQKKNEKVQKNEGDEDK